MLASPATLADDDRAVISSSVLTFTADLSEPPTLLFVNSHRELQMKRVHIASISDCRAAKLRHETRGEIAGA